MARHRKTEHLYRGSPQHRGAEIRKFEARYGKIKGKKIYFATVGKVKRERMGRHK